MNTPFLDSIYTRANFDRDLVFKFFTIFSLFEFALKKLGHRTKSGELKADWDDFARNIDNRFFPNSTTTIQTSVDYLLNYPPKKQVLDPQGQMIFDDIHPNRNTNSENLSVYIRRVRNNLFHGGKFVYDFQRDTELIKCSLIILEAWVQLDANLQNELSNITS